MATTINPAFSTRAWEVLRPGTAVPGVTNLQLRLGPNSYPGDDTHAGDSIGYKKANPLLFNGKPCPLSNIQTDSPGEPFLWTPGNPSDTNQTLELVIAAGSNFWQDIRYSPTFPLRYVLGLAQCPIARVWAGFAIAPDAAIYPDGNYAFNAAIANLQNLNDSTNYDPPVNKAPFPGAPTVGTPPPSYYNPVPPLQAFRPSQIGGVGGGISYTSSGIDPQPYNLSQFWTSCAVPYPADTGASKYSGWVDAQSYGAILNQEYSQTLGDYPLRHPNFFMPGALVSTTGIGILWIRIEMMQNLGSCGYLGRLWLAPLQETNYNPQPILAGGLGTKLAPPQPPIGNGSYYTDLINYGPRAAKYAPNFGIKEKIKDNTVSNETSFFQCFVTVRNRRREIEIPLEGDRAFRDLIDRSIQQQKGPKIPFFWFPNVGGYGPSLLTNGAIDPNNPFNPLYSGKWAGPNMPPPWDCFYGYFDEWPEWELETENAREGQTQGVGDQNYKCTLKLVEEPTPIIDALPGT